MGLGVDSGYLNGRGSMTQLYDHLGGEYRRFRRPDGRIAKLVEDALGQAEMVVNVGAGTGSYEPTRGRVVAVEPSMTMIAQRRTKETPVVRASAGNLPFRDKTFEAALAVLTVSHWPNPGQGLRELVRVARSRVVILTWDPAAPGFWLVDRYFPEILRIDQSIFPSMEDFRGVLGPISIIKVPIPHDCSDGFLGAYWRRPRAYLDPGVRGAISTFSRLEEIDPGLERLRRDLDSGEWVRRYGHLLSRRSLDLGYRLVVSAVKSG